MNDSSVVIYPIDPERLASKTRFIEKVWWFHCCLITLSTILGLNSLDLFLPLRRSPTHCIFHSPECA